MRVKARAKLVSCVILLFASLAILQTFTLYVNNGYFFLGDQGVPLNLSYYLHVAFLPWNFQTSTPNGPISYPALLSSVLFEWIFHAVQLGEKVTLTFFFFLSGFLFYYSITGIYFILTGKRYHVPAEIGGIISGIVYMFNPFAISQALLIEIIPYYSLFPLFIFLFFSILVGGPKIYKILLLCLTYLLISSSGQYGALDSILLGFVVTLFILILGKIRLVSLLSYRKALMSILIGIVPVLIWLLLLGYLSISGRFQFPSLLDSYSYARLGPSGYGYEFSFINTISLNFTTGFFIFSNISTEVAGLIILIVAAIGSVTILWKHRSNIVLYYLCGFLAIIYCLSVILTIRQVPFLYISDYIAKIFFNTGLFWQYYRNPNNYAVFLVFSESSLLFLSLVFLLNTLHDEKGSKREYSRGIHFKNLPNFFWKKLASTLIIIIVLVSVLFLSTAPTGNVFQNHMKSTLIPQQYIQANNFLDLHSTGKSLILPPSSYTHPIFTWSGGLSFPAAWPSDAFNVPLLVGTNSESDLFCYYTYFEQIDNLIYNDSQYLAPFGVSNIIIHNDQLPLGYFSGNVSVHLNQLLNNQTDVRALYNNSIINIFGTSYHSNSISLSNPVALCGGLISYLLFADSGLNTSEFSPIFLSELNKDGKVYTLDHSNIVVFGPYENISDAFLNYEDTNQIPLPNYINQVGQSGWSKISDFNPLIQQMMVKDNLYVINDGYFFGSGESIYSSSNGSKILIPTNPSLNCDLFIHAISSPFSGNITISNGQNDQIISLYNPHSVKQVWIPINKDNSVTKYLLITNDNGTNFLNSVLPINSLAYKSTFNSFKQLISHKTVIKLNVSLYSMNGYLLQSFPDNLHYYNIFARALNIKYAQLFNLTGNNATSLEMQFEVYNYTKGTGGVEICIYNATNGVISAERNSKPIYISSKNLTLAATNMNIPLKRYNLTSNHEYAIVMSPVNYSVNLSRHYIAFNVAHSINKTSANSSNGTLLAKCGSKWINTDVSSYYRIYSPGIVSNPLIANKVNVSYHILFSNENAIIKGGNISPEELNQVFSFHYTLNGKNILIQNGSTYLIIIYDQTYNPAWEMNNEESIPSYFMLNGFFINVTVLNYSVELHYALSFYFYLGNYLILATFLSFAGATIVSYAINRNKIKMK